MPQCKMNYCKEPAALGRPWRKQYCLAHGEAYLAKNREFAQKRLLLPDCAGDCGGKVPLWKVDMGSDLCHVCSQLSDKQAADYRAQVVSDEYEMRKMASLNGCVTVADLRSWILKYAFK